MRISIGILAHNEETSIAETIGSLFGQTIFQESIPNLDSIQIVCVPNGCTDRTADVARSALSAGIGQCALGSVTAEVRELSASGKTNAWNHFVHQFADHTAHYFVMLDGDVLLNNPTGIRSMLAALENDPELYVAAGTPIKHVALKARPSLYERISLVHNEAPPGLCGMFYCARASFMRSLWLPEGMIGEDDFLMHMTRTSLFAEPDSWDFRKLAHPPDATMLFEAYLKPTSIIRAVRRRAVTSTINWILYDHLRHQLNDGENAGEYLRRRSMDDPDWLRRLVAEEIAQRGWWVIRPGFATRHWRQWLRLPFPRKFVRLPVKLVGLATYAVASLAGNRDLKKGKTTELWFVTRTQRLREHVDIATKV